MHHRPQTTTASILSTKFALSATRGLWLASIALLSLLLPFTASHAAAEDELLDPNDAFKLTQSINPDGSISLNWKIADGYYMYRGRFKFSSLDPTVVIGEAESPTGKVKNDEFFGRIETYRKDVTIRIPTTQRPDSATSFTLKTTSQGCADLGVCYPPQKRKLTINFPAQTIATQVAPESTPQTLPQTLPAIASKAMDSPLAALADFGKTLGLSNDDSEFLDPDLAFQASVIATSQESVQANWRIADKYYLYLKRLKFRLITAPGDTQNASLGKPVFPTPDIKDDPLFGKTEVFHNALSVDIPVTFASPNNRQITLEVQYQGCADAGLCYPPQKKQFTLDLAKASPSKALSSTAVTTTLLLATATVNDPFVSAQDGIASSLASDGKLKAIFWFFLAGLALAFTPCVFPMIPILSSIVVGQGEKTSTRRAFVLSLVYVLAMAITYTIIGVVAGKAGANLQAIFQDPWILGSFVAVFVALAMSMFGFYELQLPSALQSRLTQISNSQQGGTLAGVAIMGLLSALIVGPCVAPPLMGALIYIGQTGDAVFGGMALFSMAMGMGVPLLIIGTSAGKLVPRAGAWMDTVKAVFGVTLLGLGIWMLERIVPAEVTLALWATLIVVSAIYMGALETVKQGASGWMRLWKGLGVIFLIYGTLMFIGLASGGNNIIHPLKGIAYSGGSGMGGEHAELKFKSIHNLAQLEAEIQTANLAGKSVFLDFYADWCTECKRMEATTFQDATVITVLSNTVLLQADVTANNDEHQALLKRFKLLGPPAMLFFGNDGAERSNYRVIGYMDAENFAAHSQRALQ